MGLKQSAVQLDCSNWLSHARALGMEPGDENEGVNHQSQMDTLAVDYWTSWAYE